MDIKLFSLCNQASPDAERGKKQILECAKNFFPEVNGFSEFSSQKRMLVAISQSLLAADIVLVAVQSTMYNTTKKMLCSALDMKCTSNSEVAAALKNKLDKKELKPNVYSANSALPQTALLLPTDDYINCGFALTSGGQHIIYMPVEDEKAQEIILGSLYDYFSELCDQHIAVNAMKYRHKALITRAIKKLNERSLRVAVAGNDASNYLIDYMSKKDAATIVIDLNYDLPNETDLKSLAISMARKVRENNHTDLGVYISDMFTDSDSEIPCAYISIANEEGTKTYRLAAESDESEKSLSKVCVDKLLLLLCNPDRIGNLPEESAEEKTADDKLKGILGIAASAAVLVASVAGFIIALVMR